MAASATSLLENIGETPGPERESALLEIVRQGQHPPILWSELHVLANGVRATLFVSSDALQIGSDEDAVRITLSARSAQAVADHFGTLLPTPRICELVWARADVRLTPCPQAADQQMSSTRRMLEHSRAVDAKRRGRAGLIENVGKHWVLTNRLGENARSAANYGWFDAEAPNRRLWQPLGLAHNLDYVDYSQVVRLVRRDVIVNGSVRDIQSVGTDPALCALVSGEGPLSVWRVGEAPAQPPAAWAPVPEDVAELDALVAPFRALRVGMAGQDVAAWQRQLIFDGHDLGPWGADGKFGIATHNATVAWQRARSVPGTGVVDEATLAAVGAPEKPPAMPSLDPIPFLAARNFTPAQRERVDWLVIHSMEWAETSTTAESCAQFFAGTSAPRASAHYCVDTDSIVQCVRDEDVAWHAPGANRAGIGIEHAGYARQSAEEWADRYTAAMLELSARLAARLCQRWNIPAVFVDAEGLRRGERGITTHRAATWAFGESTHLDPGPHFPMDEYLVDVKRWLAG